MRTVISKSCDPYYNIALERYLFSREDAGDILYFWQNVPCVVIGRNQNVFLECDLEYMAQNEILPVRRFSGGGAVYQDMGNLNITYITNREDNHFITEMISTALEAFGIEAVTSQRNDLLYQGRKFSGTACFTDGTRRMYHGTLMLDVDLEHLCRALTPSKLKMESHGIQSVRARVLNLCMVNALITPESFIRATLAAVKKTQVLDISGEPARNEIQKMAAELASHRWICGGGPSFTATLEYRLKGALFQVCAEVQDGIITGAEVFTDSLDPINPHHLTKRLQGIPFDRKQVEKALEELINGK